jgi:hypothetical protein
MALDGSSSLAFIPTLSDTDETLDRILADDGITRRLVQLALLMTFFALLYGVVMGSYQGSLQAFAAGIKLVLLFVATLASCFPAFYVIQSVLGSQLRLFQILLIVLSGIALSCAIMISFAPIVVVFLLTGDNYDFLRLLHVAVFVTAGAFGILRVVSVLKYACEKRGIYPQTGVVVFRFWAVIMAFVGIQLAWSLRPFVGDPGEAFQLSRKYEGNFYTAVLHSAKRLFEAETPPSVPPAPPVKQPGDTTINPTNLFAP